MRRVYSGLAASRFLIALVSLGIGATAAFADPGHGVCIQGTNPSEHNQAIGYIERACLKSPVDGSSHCDDSES